MLRLECDEGVAGIFSDLGRIVIGMNSFFYSKCVLRGEANLAFIFVFCFSAGGCLCVASADQALLRTSLARYLRAFG